MMPTLFPTGQGTTPPAFFSVLSIPLFCVVPIRRLYCLLCDCGRKSRPTFCLVFCSGEIFAFFFFFFFARPPVSVNSEMLRQYSCTESRSFPFQKRVQVETRQLEPYSFLEVLRQIHGTYKVSLFEEMQVQLRCELLPFLTI